MVKIAVVGSGPAGRNLAMGLAKKGFEVHLYEKDKIGGTCLNYGCTYITGLREMANIVKNLSIIKNKKVHLEEIISFRDLQKRIREVLDKIRKKLERETKESGVKIIYKEFKNDNSYDYIVYAAGSLREDNYKDITKLKDLPNSILFVGGVAALEYASIFSDFGCKVYLKTRSFLKDIKDEEIKEFIKNRLIDFKIVDKEVDADKVFYLIGGKERFKVDRYLRVSDNVFACGDCIGAGSSPLARYQAKIVAENIVRSVNNKELIEYKKPKLIPRTIRLTLPISYVGEQTDKFIKVKSSVGQGNFFRALNEIGINKIYLKDNKVVGAIAMIPSYEVISYFSQYLKGIEVYKEFIEVHPSTDIFYKILR
ncbi:FAD-dependent oxidoreductase [Methanocaldococcus sp.]